MRKLLSLAVVAVGVYLLMHNWSSGPVTFDDILSKLTGGSGKATPTPDPAAPTAGGNPAAPGAPNFPSGPGGRNSSAPAAPPVESWSPQVVSGLRLDLPFPLQESVVKLPARPNMTVQVFEGQSGTRVIYLAHAMNSTLVGSPMLAWADKSLSTLMGKAGMRVVSTNTPTLLRGMRARRTDLTSIAVNPVVHGRMLLLEAGSNVWLIECHAQDTDPDGERIFMRIATSAQRL